MAGKGGLMTPEQAQEAMLRAAGIQVAPVEPVKLEAEERAELTEDHSAFFLRRRERYVGLHEAILRTPVSQLNKFSYGYKILAAEIERGWKQAIPPPEISVRVTGEAKPLSDVALLALAQRLGVLPEVIDADVERPALTEGA